MKVIVDGIIENLQDNGGCTVYFAQILTLLQKNKINLNYIKFKDKEGNIPLFGENTKVSCHIPKWQERWRDVVLKDVTSDTVFHSTHYRLAKQKVKTVTTVHDFTYELYRKGPAKWMHSWQKFRAIRNSDLVICVSQNTADDLMKFCPIDPKKIRVVYNGVSPDYHRLSSVEKTNEVVFIGARGWYKNFTLAVETLKHQPELMLSIVGGGKLSDEEVQLLESKIPGRYKWLGRLTDEELNQVYNRAHCLFYPSSYEGFGIPVIEAMRSGCPVIAVNVSSIPEVAGSAAILTKQADLASFNQAFCTLNNEHTRKDIILRGLEQANRFSWEKCYQDTLAVYNELNTLPL
ncbi:glycosyltransferase family 4 protein [Pseudoalteromonas sp. S3431]|uniref:glycosyltransferase family 4 protein n=1 Tax=Pseudoalteromonas sp. S3431 TaxID=579537 RepID=UPI0004A0E87E|nr:glycosyltransferase family 1 protein [Pseudoalteromonas sp. S3431]KDC54829.1 mannosyltransferase [Pseudoalteromonas sp. S3431]